MGYILGVDGGGTKTTAVIASSEGKILVESTSGASSVTSVGEKRAAENLNSAVFEAAGNLDADDLKFTSSSFGFAGLNVEDDLRIYRSIVFNERLKKHLEQEKVFICNDTRIGLEAGSSAPNKIIIIAGTGSNCFGINESGRQAGCTGWDYILADEGSGYEVSVRALRSVMRAYDGRGAQTMLSRAILEELGLKYETDIVRWTYGKPFSKERLGKFARIVCSCADKGDAISRRILGDEASESILSVSTVVEKLGLEENKFDLVFVGGLFKCEKHFKNIVIDGLRQRFKGISFRPLVAKPVHGAIKLALDRL